MLNVGEIFTRWKWVWIVQLRVTCSDQFRFATENVSCLPRVALTAFWSKNSCCSVVDQVSSACNFSDCSLCRPSSAIYSLHSSLYPLVGDHHPLFHLCHLLMTQCFPKLVITSASSIRYCVFGSSVSTSVSNDVCGDLFFQSGWTASCVKRTLKSSSTLKLKASFFWCTKVLLWSKKWEQHLKQYLHSSNTGPSLAGILEL